MTSPLEDSLVPWPAANPATGPRDVYSITDFHEESVDETTLGYLSLHQLVAGIVDYELFSVYLFRAGERAVMNAFRLERTGSGVQRLPVDELPAATQGFLRELSQGVAFLARGDDQSGLGNKLLSIPGTSLCGSTLVLPLHGAGRSLGVMLLQKRAVDAYSNDDLEKLREAMTDAAPIVRQLALLLQLTGRAEQIRSLNSISAEISRSLDLQRLVPAILQQMAAFLQIPHALFRLRKGDELRVYHSQGFDAVYLRNLREISLQQHPHYASMFLRREALNEHRGLLWPEAKAIGVQSMLSVPVKSEGQLLGSITLASPDINAFPPDSRRYVEIVASHLAPAIEIASLRHKIAASEGRLRTFFDNTEDAIIIANSLGLVTDWNDAATSIFGHAVEELRGINLGALFTGTWQARIQQHLRESSLTAPFVVSHAPLRRLDTGEAFTARATLTPLYTGNSVEPEGYSLIIRDFESENAGSSAGRDKSSDGQDLHHVGGPLLSALAAVRYRARPGIPMIFEEVEGQLDALLGVNARELLTDPSALERAVVTADRSEFRRRMEAPFRHGPTHLQYRVRQRNGRLVLVHEVISPQRDEETGAVQHIEGALIALPQGTIQDRILTHERQKALSILAGGLAHELNNISIGILSASNLALELVDEEHPVARYLRIIDRSGQRARDLTEKLLLFSQHRRGRPTTIELNHLLASFIPRMNAWVCPGAFLEFAFAPEVPPVEADPDLMLNALRFLVENAWEAQKRRGSIKIFTGSFQCDGQLPDVESPATPGMYALIGVEDHGPGFSEDDRQTLGDPFVSSHSAGRGLGLAATRGIVSGAGGYLGIHSVEGQGATFTIYLPMPSPDVAPAFSTNPDTAACRRPAPTRASVLVVDSDHLQRDLIIQTLSGQGIRCLAASSFVEAMSLLRQQVGFIDLIVIDLSAAARDTSGDTIGGIVQEIRSINPLTRVLGRMSQGNAQLPDFLAHDPFFRTLKAPSLSRELLQAVRECLNLSNQSSPSRSG